MHWRDRPELANDSDEKILEEAFHSRRRGDHRDAVERFMTVYRRDESNPFAPVEAARSHAALMEYDVMRALLELAEVKSEGDALVSLLIGDAWNSFHFPREALAAYRRAAAAAPEEPEPAAKILVCLERMNGVEEAFLLLDALPPRLAGHPSLVPIRATLALRRGLAEDALSLLKTIPREAADDPEIEPRLLATAASALERLGRFDEAWEAMLKAKRFAAAKPGSEFRRKLFPGHLEFLAEARKRTPARVATSPYEPADGRRKIAFLLGHPRSGTTVVERILDHHPDIASASEYPAFELGVGEAAKRMEAVDLTFADSRLTPDRDALRRDYFDRMSRVFSEGIGDRLLLDKNPGLTDGVHGLAAVFPEAKYIVMLREPRDVILSCLFRDFGDTRLGVACHTPEGAAEAWTATMRQWLFMREWLPADSWIEVRYEHFVETPDATAAELLSFLGFDRAGVSSEAALAGDGFIRTPTYDQIGRKVRPDSIGRWRNHAGRFEAMRSAIEPTMNALGYSW